MAVPAINISIDKSTSFSQDFIVKNNDQTAMNLTGYTATSKIRKYPEDSTSNEFACGITSSTGTINVSMGVSTTALLASGRNYYDIIITSGVGTVTKVYEGTAMVTATVSA
tara:strand:+ start:391 stop:723 length:333 start_codon:yes stop_codon:yes gene_type:complete